MAPGKREHPADVVAMFMGDQDSSKLCRISIQTSETPERLALPETAINHQAGCAGFDQQRIARAAAPQRRVADHCNCW